MGLPCRAPTTLARERRPLIFVIAKIAGDEAIRGARSRGWLCSAPLARTKDRMDWQPHTARAREWFESLRTRICTEFEAIEREAGSRAMFDYLAWDREEEGNADPG